MLTDRETEALSIDPMAFRPFFDYALERHSIYLRRMVLHRPREEWTQDPILQTYRFCNVFRELDTTTMWYRRYVRERLCDDPRILLATVVYRWFNRIQTGEAIFLQGTLGGKSAFERMLETSSVAPLREAILAYCGRGPYVTGSYIIKTPDGMSKLEGVLSCIQQFCSSRVPVVGTVERIGWREMADRHLAARVTSLEFMWNWLRNFPFLGDFMSYEIVSDLRYTALLSRSSDIDTWANPGPGAMRGLNRIFGRPLKATQSKRASNREMQIILAAARTGQFWPRTVDSLPCAGLPIRPDHLAEDWPQWDMRTVEHTLCEFDKMERVRLGEGAPRQKFRR